MSIDAVTEIAHHEVTSLSKPRTPFLADAILRHSLLREPTHSSSDRQQAQRRHALASAVRLASRVSAH